MVLMFHVSDLSDFQRFLYDKTHQISDFFEETLLKIARFIRLYQVKRHFSNVFQPLWVVGFNDAVCRCAISSQKCR